MDLNVCVFLATSYASLANSFQERNASPLNNNICIKWLTIIRNKIMQLLYCYEIITYFTSVVLALPELMSKTHLSVKKCYDKPKEDKELQNKYWNNFL
jgi:hypothetical protein